MLVYEKCLNQIVIKDKPRQVVYNKELNVYKRKRTFSGIVHLHHWSILNDYIDVNKPLHCLEIGSHEGQSTIYFLKHLLKHEKSSLLCCDPWIKSHWLNLHPTNLRYEDLFDFNIMNNDGQTQITKYRGLNTDLFKEEWFSETLYDIIYIGGGHAYKHALENINNCFPKLKSGGIIIFDDYDKHFADYDIDEAGKWCDPVKQAVDEFIKKTNNIKIIHQLYQIIILKL